MWKGSNFIDILIWSKFKPLNISYDYTCTFIIFRLSEEMAMLKFPKVKNILWDHDSTGDDLHLSLSYYRYELFHVVLTEHLLAFPW